MINFRNLIVSEGPPTCRYQLFQDAATKAVRQLREGNTAQQLAEANSVQVLSTLLGNLVTWNRRQWFGRARLEMIFCRKPCWINLNGPPNQHYLSFAVMQLLSPAERWYLMSTLLNRATERLVGYVGIEKLQQQCDPMLGRMAH